MWQLKHSHPKILEEDWTEKGVLEKLQVNAYVFSPPPCFVVGFTHSWFDAIYH